jgi:hypothetical protein
MNINNLFKLLSFIYIINIVPGIFIFYMLIYGLIVNIYNYVIIFIEILKTSNITSKFEYLYPSHLVLYYFIYFRL